ncbi:hypothetical protein [Cryobacterium sp. M91]|uniref:hypothetical protein n=1 Tax=Cryobacterium sp. M91 TaxID=2048294 RepID=UPI0018EC31A1|nr:hypothetical protein [Cryobacterium sp. M91]
MDEALADHPRIIQTPTDGFSRREQASADADDAELAKLLTTGQTDADGRLAALGPVALLAGW